MADAGNTDPFKQFEQDISHILHAAVEGAGGGPAQRRGKKGRRPGGQPGNQNARKHGLYSNSLTQEQREALQDARDADHLADEVAILRVKLRSLLAQPDPDYALILRGLDTLARLVRAEDRIRLGI